MKKRLESDFIGKVEVPAGAYYGSFTVRAADNFRISGLKAPRNFIKAMGLIKKAAATVNGKLGELDPAVSRAMIKAADEFIAGKFDTEYPIDVFQAGGGTPFNMNCNEVIANRANEILGKAKGAYNPVTPNNHVNWAQSSNDVIPTAIALAALLQIKPLLSNLDLLQKALFRKGKEFKSILKIGRTHLMDAVPVTLGQEFEAYGSAISRSMKLVKNSFNSLLEINIGGTAVGTGVTAHPEYRRLMVRELGRLAGLKFRPAVYPMELTHGSSVFAAASASLKVLADDLIRICNDLRLLNSGPAGGIGEISLPEVEPGSSIMPGKVNPSIPEVVTMVCFQVHGNDLAVNMAVQAGQLELNVMTPVIMHNLISSLDLLTSACDALTEKCIKGIKANPDRCSRLLSGSLCTATALSAYLGYKGTSAIVSFALHKNKSLEQIILEYGLMAPGDLKHILSAEKMTRPNIIDKKLAAKIKGSGAYADFIRGLEKNGRN